MTELAKRYGGSLYDLAAEEKLTEELLQELQTAVDRKRSAAPCWTRRSRGRIRTLSTSSNFCARKI